MILVVFKATTLLQPWSVAILFLIVATPEFRFQITWTDLVIKANECLFFTIFILDSLWIMFLITINFNPCNERNILAMLIVHFTMKTTAAFMSNSQRTTMLLSRYSRSAAENRKDCVFTWCQANKWAWESIYLRYRGPALMKREMSEWACKWARQRVCGCSR